MRKSSGRGGMMKVSEITKDNISNEIVDRLLFEGLEYDGRAADIIIVLGSRTACNYRVPLAAELFHKGKASRLIFCGGKVQMTMLGEMAEYKAMLMSAEKCGIPRERIYAETRSQTTAENLMFAREIIEREYPQCGSVIIVTTAYHMRRAQKLGEKILRQEIITCPAGRGSTQRENWYKTEKGRMTALDECLKFGYYIRNGLIDDFEI